MNKIEKKLFTEFSNTRIYYQNQKLQKENPHECIDNYENGKCKICGSWQKWKKWEECSEQEQEEANLRELFENEIVLDIETKTRTEEIKTKLEELKWSYILAESGSRGLHFHLFPLNIQHYDEKGRNRIRKYIIKMFLADEAKSTEHSLIARFDKPHFKTMNNKSIIHEQKFDESFFIPKSIIEELKKQIAEEQKLNDALKTEDSEFKDYFEKDPFWLYLKNNSPPIPVGSLRNNVIFPNLAIACAKSGKSEEEIKTIITEFLKEKMNDIPYSVFYGWYKKAIKGLITTYNKFQLNDWMKSFTPEVKNLYDIKVVDNVKTSTEKTTFENNESDEFDFEVYCDSTLENLKNIKTEWLVDKWLAKHSITCLAAKAATYKSTLITNMCYCISHELPFLGLYPTKNCKILYLNEENSTPALYSIVHRVRKGLQVETLHKDDVYMTQINNMTLDNEKMINAIIKKANTLGAQIIVFDTIRRFFSANENDATEVNKLFSTLKRIRAETNSTIITIVHLKKSDNNKGVQNDVRDMIRGSSEFFNNPDCIIGIDRKHRQKGFILSMIKNRFGGDNVERIINIESSPEDDFIKFSDGGEKGETKEVIISKPEKCADEVIKFLEDNKLTIFKRADLSPIFNNYATTTTQEALKLLKNEGTITETIGGKHTTYSFNGIVKTQNNSELQDKKTTNLENTENYNKKDSDLSAKNNTGSQKTL